MTPRFAVASRPRVGEAACGDATVVRALDGGALFAVIDALGHGPTAAVTAQAAVAHLTAAPIGHDVEAVMRGLDGALKHSRGAAVMLGLLAGGRVSCCGVGNVELRAAGARLPILLTPGVVGYGLRRLRVFGGELAAGNRLLVFSDGVSGRFSTDEVRDLPPEEASRRLLERYGRAADDATVMVVEAR